MAKQIKDNIKILFVCHGNICRSPMAEYVMKDLVEREGMGDRFFIASAATSTEELGNPVHPGTRNKLRQLGISAEGKYAVRLEKGDYEKYDLILGMEQYNLKNIMRIIGKDPEDKVHCLLDFTKSPRDIADPWYTGNFDRTYEDIDEGCRALLQFLKNKEV